MTSNIKPKRRPRIGADSAHSWARNLTLGNPHAKAVLMMCCFYTNDEACCIMGMTTLAQDTDLSEQTVRSRLKWLEEIGAIARAPCWLDEHGRRNYEGRGKRTTDEIRLLIEADADQIENRAANGADMPENNPQPPAASPIPQTGLNPVSPTPALCQPYDSAEGLDSSELELEDSPPAPPSGGDEMLKTDDEDLRRFKSTYPEPTNKPDKLREAWDALDVCAKRTAQRGAEGAREIRKKNPKKALLDPFKFLRDGLAAEYARYAPPEAAPIVELAEGTDEWKALALMHLIGSGNPIPSGPARMRAPIPAGATSLAALFDQAPPRSAWRLAADKTKSFIAWSERMHEWLRRYAEPCRIYVDAAGKPVATAAEAATYEVDLPGGPRTFQKRVHGMLVPSEWPPPKHQQTSAAARPQVVMTADDEAVMAGDL